MSNLKLCLKEIYSTIHVIEIYIKKRSIFNHLSLPNKYLLSAPVKNIKEKLLFIIKY